jgi:hypothetical protein
MHDQRLQCPADRAEGQVAGHQVVPGHLQQRLGDAFEVAGQGAVEDLLARQLRFFDEIGGTLAVPLPQIAEGCSPWGSCCSSDTWFMNS